MINNLGSCEGILKKTEECRTKKKKKTKNEAGAGEDEFLYYIIRYQYDKKKNKMVIHFCTKLKVVWLLYVIVKEYYWRKKEKKLCQVKSIYSRFLYIYGCMI